MLCGEGGGEGEEGMKIVTKPGSKILTEYEVNTEHVEVPFSLIADFLKKGVRGLLNVNCKLLTD